MGDGLRKVRFEHPDRLQEEKKRPEKTFRWEHQANDGSWKPGKGGRSHAAYVNEPFRDRDLVESALGVESERSANSVGKLGVPAFSFKELTPENAVVFTGLEIRMLPDKDVPGRELALKAIETLRPYARSLAIIEPPSDWPEAGDLHDAIADYGWVESRIRTLLASAVLGVSKGKKVRAEDAEGQVDPTHRRLPNIRTTDRQLRDVSREALDALRLFDIPPSLFARAGKAVCITEEESGRHVITDVSDRILRNRVTRSADFYEVATTIQNCAPPIDVVKDISAMSPTEWGFPPLQSLIESPALREDGTLITLPGYDEPSRLYYAPAPGLILPEIPEEPCTDHIEVAIEMVHDIIGEFPFVDAASRANAIASMLTPVCRPAIKGPTPLALFDATAQGSGKTLLSEVVSLIVSGREGALFSAPREPEEWRKQLTSVLREGSPTIIIDNVNWYS